MRSAAAARDRAAGATWSSRRRVIAGESMASPRAITRTASTSCWGGTSLSRKPLAPARSASMTYSSRSNVVRMSTRWSRSRRVASTPSSRGMRMSITITSGAALAACSIASRPSAASDDDLDVGLAVEDHAEARAHQRLVVDDQHADRHSPALALGSRASTAKPPALARPGRERAAVEGDALAHADEPVAARVGRSARAVAVVEDRELDAPRRRSRCAPRHAARRRA